MRRSKPLADLPLLGRDRAGLDLGRIVLLAGDKIEQSIAVDQPLAPLPGRTPGRPVTATITAMGVASPRASGQAMTNTVIVRVTAKSRVCPIHQNHTANVSRPMTIVMIGSATASIRFAA